MRNDLIQSRAWVRFGIHWLKDQSTAGVETGGASGGCGSKGGYHLCAVQQKDSLFRGLDLGGVVAVQKAAGKLTNHADHLPHIDDKDLVCRFVQVRTQARLKIAR